MTPPNASPSGERNRGIDILRGLAIVLVILNHVGIRIPLAKSDLASILPARFLHDLNYNGYEAVCIFFVISGFLITSRAQQLWGGLRSISLREFYVRRASRILPSLLALVAVLSVLHLAGIANYTIDKPTQSLPGAAASALGLYLNWYEGVTGYLPGNWDVLWSLSIEELFYLAFPLLCLACGGTRWFVAILAAFVVAMPFAHAAAQGNDIWQEKAYLPGMGAIAVGVLAALLVRHVPAPSQRTARVLRIGGIVGIAAILFAGRWIWQLLLDGYLLVLTLAAASLVVGLHWRSAQDAKFKLPGLGWLRSCGRLSYEIYLTHMFCVYAIVDIARASGTDKSSGWLWYPVAIGASWLLGWIVARGFSQPVERWLRDGAARRARATAAAASV